MQLLGPPQLSELCAHGSWWSRHRASTLAMRSRRSPQGRPRRYRLRSSPSPRRLRPCPAAGGDCLDSTPLPAIARVRAGLPATPRTQDAADRLERRRARRLGECRRGANEQHHEPRLESNVAFGSTRLDRVSSSLARSSRGLQPFMVRASSASTQHACVRAQAAGRDHGQTLAMSPMTPRTEQG